MNAIDWFRLLLGLVLSVIATFLAFMAAFGKTGTTGKILGVYVAGIAIGACAAVIVQKLGRKKSSE